MFHDEPRAYVSLPKELKDSELQSVILKTLEDNHAAAGLSDTGASSSLSDGGLNRIRDSDFMIADVTRANANVMFEVGMAVAMGKRILLLSRERSTDLPPELRALQVAIYRPEALSSVQTYLQMWLRDAMAERESAKAR